MADGIINCVSYGVHTAQIGIMAEQVTHWWEISYNGNLGVEVELLSGKAIRIGGSITAFEKQLAEALGDK